jgi:two-component system sensor kinase FixL
MPEGDPAEILAAIVASSESAIIAVGLDGTIVSWNPGAERIFGYSADEVVGRSLALLMPPGSEALGPLLERVGRGEQVAPHETVRLAKDGRPVNVRVTASPIRNAARRLVGATMVARDITDRMRLDAALRTTEARWRAIIDSAVDGVIVIDEQGLIESFNPAAERMFGYSEQEILGRNVNALMPSPDRERHDAYIRRYVDTGEARIIGRGREVTAVRRDGTTFPVHLAVGDMRIGDERHFTGILHDLTARVRLEAQLREGAALARLGEMAAVMAHEVRNPLAAVRGAIQVIGSRLPENSREAPVVKEIIARIDALNGLLNDLLLFARTPQPSTAPLSLRGLITATTDLLSRDPAFAALQFQIEGDPPPIDGDVELLKIVFQNLLINAGQAMQGRGAIRISLGARNGVAQVAIADSGPGMAPEVRQKLFQPFFTTKARGTGLGLATSRRLIELHHGTIAVECPPSGGTVATIRLPTHPPQDAPGSTD